MTGSRKCAPGCTCNKHSELTADERAQRHRDQSRESMRKYNSSGVCPSCAGPKTPQSELCQQCRRALWTEEDRLASEDRRKQLNRERVAHLRATDPEYVKRNRENQRRHGRRYQIKSKFGITLEDWDRILVEQSGRCYLCSRPLQGGRTDIHIDHDHDCCPGRKTCGKCIRGLACQKCNQGVGQFDDDPQLMRTVADNLEAANQRLREQRE